MTDPDTVARALARLANGRCPSPESEFAEGEPKRVVADAEAAVDRVDTAAAFVGDGGKRRLRRAVDAAEGAGDEEVASRGRAVLRTLSRFRDAAGDRDEPSPDAGRTTSTPLAQRSSPEGS